MRIRKHAQISPSLIYAGASSCLNQGEGAVVVQVQAPYVCQLNQSPWDSLTLHLSEEDEDHTAELLPPLPPSLPYPVDGELSSVSDFPEVENSDISMNWDENKKNCDGIIIDKNGKFEFDGNGVNQMSGSSHCRKNMKERHNSNYNLQQSSSSSSLLKRHYKLTKKPGKIPATRNKLLRPKKPLPSSNPYEFYYYSGFGPHWGKDRRGGSVHSNDSLINNGLESVVEEESYSSGSFENDEDVIEVDTPASRKQSAFEESYYDRIHDNDDVFTYVEDDDDNEDDEGFVSKKRARKPIKARSLKSLM